MQDKTDSAKRELTLVTFQSLDALKDLIDKGCLECDAKYINLEKYGSAYAWVSEKMRDRIKNPSAAGYPLWCWVKCYRNICPPKRRGKPVQGFDVKITFSKPEAEVFITDFRRYSFVLNQTYIPDSLADKERFDRKLAAQAQDSAELYQEIRSSFDRCITADSDILQGCVWRISLNDVKKIEFLTDKNYRFGSLNYRRSNGESVNWIESFYRTLQ